MLLALLVPLTVGSITGGKLERLEAAQTDEGTRWTLEVSTASRETREVSVALELPEGVAITRMTMTLAGADEPLVSEALALTEARATYEQIVEEARDPALLEHAVTVNGREHLTLRVFPLVTGRNATITIVAGDADNVTATTSLVARFRGQKSVMAHAKDPRSLGDGFHARTQVVPEVPNSRALLAGAARPRRAVDRAALDRRIEEVTRSSGVSPRRLVAVGRSDAR